VVTAQGHRWCGGHLTGWAFLLLVLLAAVTLDLVSAQLVISCVTWMLFGIMMMLVTGSVMPTRRRVVS
jgi:hypothetical protein